MINPMNGPTRRIEIPEDTATQLERRLDGTEFESVDAYVTVALGQLLRELDQQSDERRPRVETDATEESRDEAVEDQLESLGYL